METFCLLKRLTYALFFGLFKVLLIIRANLTPMNPPLLKQLEEKKKKHTHIVHYL